MMFNTLLLDRTAWDLVLDSSGNIAVASPPYALAQDVASAVKLFVNELWFNTTAGIPHFDTTLGHFPPISLIKGEIERAALTVAGVVSAQCIITGIDARQVTGEIRFIDETGATNNVNF